VSITVVTGPPGAGKTSVAAVLARSRPLGVHLVGDRFFDWIVSGFVPPWMVGTSAQNATVIEAIGAAAARYAQGGYDVVADAIIGPWFLRNFQRAIGSAADDVSYVVLRPTRDIALRRALDRRGDHDLVDARPVDAMYDAFEDLGLFEHHVVDSSEHELTATVKRIRGGLERGAFALTDRHLDDTSQLARRHGVEDLP
jgi:adenylate kinase family enzyme